MVCVFKDEQRSFLEYTISKVGVHGCIAGFARNATMHNFPLFIEMLAWNLSDNLEPLPVRKGLDCPGPFSRQIKNNSYAPRRSQIVGRLWLD
jgi:hypothetical protein